MKLKLLFYIIISVLPLFPIYNSFAQNETFTGRLVDLETKDPIANAIISEEDGKHLTYSNIMGYFEVKGPARVIVVKHISYKTVATTLNSESPKFLMKVPAERYSLRALIIKEMVEGQGYYNTFSPTEEEIKKGDESNLEKEQLASFPGGLKAFHDYLTYRVHINKDSLLAPFSLNILFTIDKSGELKLDSIVGGLHFSGTLRSILENSPKWVPASQNGLPVSVTFKQDLTYNTIPQPENVVQAEPIGGIQAFYDYISLELENKYPKQAQRFGIEGIVYVQCDIEIDGSVKNVSVIKGIGGGCDEVASEVVKNSPKWHPAKENGEVVRSQRVIPIRFLLN